MPEGVTPYWSDGTRSDAGIAIWLKKDFLKKFDTWDWEDIVLPAGDEIKRSGTKYTAELVEHPVNKDCYISR